MLQQKFGMLFLVFSYFFSQVYKYIIEWKRKVDITEIWKVVSCYSHIVLVKYISTLLEERTNWARCSENFRVFFFFKLLAIPLQGWDANPLFY